MTTHTKNGQFLLSEDEYEALQDIYTELDNALTKARGIVNCISNSSGADGDSLMDAGWAVFDQVHDARDLLRKNAALFGYDEQPDVVE